MFFEIECCETFNDIHNPSRFVLLGSAAAYGREIIPERVIK